MLAPIAHKVTTEDGPLLQVWEYPSEGPPLILCHCTGTLGRVWDPVVEHLEGQFHVFSIDTRGHGDSGAPLERDGYAWWRSGDDVLAVIEHFDLPHGVFACGHSAGGAHLAYAELAEPGTFGRLLLIDPVIAPSGHFGEENPLAEKVRWRLNTFPDLEAARERFAAKPPMDDWTPDALGAYLEHAFVEEEDGRVTLKCPGNREAWFYELGGAHDVFERLGEIEVPTLLVTGSQSYVAPLTQLQLERLPNARVYTVNGVGHFIPQQDPEATARLLLEWMQ